MTNSEAIKQLKERYIIGQKEYLNFAPQYIESLKMAMESLEENDKLKAEIEQFSNELISVRIENELLKKKNELTNYYFEQYAAAIDEIEQLKSELEQSVKLPCKVGDKLFSTENGYIEEFKVRSLNHIVNLVEFSRFDETVFFTREEAEQDLKVQVEE